MGGYTMRIIFACFLGLIVTNCYSAILVYDKRDGSIITVQMGGTVEITENQEIVNVDDSLLATDNIAFSYYDKESKKVIRKRSDEIDSIKDKAKQERIKNDVERLLKEMDSKLALGKEGFDVSNDTQSIRGKIELLKTEKANLEARE
jgi:hypothetical protein